MNVYTCGLEHVAMVLNVGSWYYTGNLKAADGHRYGFELTFFRQAIRRDSPEEKSVAKKLDSEKSAGAANDLYLAHLALSDLDGKAFYHSERTNRAGPRLAGVSETDQRVWNGNWQVRWNGDSQELQAYDARFALRLNLYSLKSPIIHGENGI